MSAPVCIWCSGDVQLVQGAGRAASSCSPRYVPLGTEHISSQKYVRELCWLNQKSHPAETASGDMQCCQGSHTAYGWRRQAAALDASVWGQPCVSDSTECSPPRPWGQKGPAPVSPLGSPIALLLVPGTRELHAWQLSPFSTTLSFEMVFSPAKKKPKYAQWDESTPRILTHQEEEFRDLSNEMRLIWASHLPASTLPQKQERREVPASQILPFNKPRLTV